MAFRTVIVGSEARLRVRAGQLIVEQGDSVAIPVEDIAVAVLECPRIAVSCGALARLAAEGVSVVVCDQKHLPSGILMPYCQHSRHLAVVREQLSATKPLKKRLWQQIVRCKIENQARCMDYLGHEGSGRLREHKESVKSGDPANLEAIAARYYFARLMPDARRHSGGCQDRALDYGYAIMRAAIARYVASYGLYPPLGLHHDAKLNAFNLADDLLEPYRPFVDRQVLYEAVDVSDAAGRASLVAQLHEPCEIAGQVRSVMTAMDMTVQSLVRCLYRRDHTQLKLPFLTVATRAEQARLME